MEVYSIGFTKKSAEQFFGILKKQGIQCLLDVRLNNVSQLAGFAKRDDLRYFLHQICNAEYIHEPLLAPTQEMLDSYKKHKGAWQDYEREFLELMAQRGIESTLDRAIFLRPTVLLCSELKSDRCHRRLVLEYLSVKWGDVQAVHL
jgi:uncharacterized protein (DUF488 family)